MVTVVAGLAAVGAVLLGRLTIINWRYPAFAAETQGIARTLTASLDKGAVRRSANILGTANRRLRDMLAQGQTETRDIFDDLMRVRDLNDAEMVYVMNTTGDVVSSTPLEDGASNVGMNYRFRPYFTGAMNGFDVVYPAMGVTTARRGIFFSSPVRAHSDGPGSSRILGVVVIKKGMQSIDALLGAFEHALALVSPDGVIFASNRPAWLFRTIHPVKGSRLSGILNSRQFGDIYQTREPAPLLPTHVGDHLIWDGDAYLVGRSILKLADENGAWELFCLADLKTFFPPPYMRAFAVSGVGMALLLLLLLYYRRRHAEAERKRRTMEAHLKEQQRMESMGILARGVAHEVNNPINVIMNYAQLMRNELGGESRHGRFAGEIIHESKRVSVIVRNLLLFSREDEGDMEPVLPHEIVAATLSLLSLLLRRESILLENRVPTDLPPIRCRQPRLHRALSALIENAREALNARYPDQHPDKSIRLSGKLLHDHGSWVRLTVEDTAGGMSVDTQHLAKLPFFTTDPSGRHPGLGLSVADGVVREHGGRLTIECEEGSYTRIHIDLPSAMERDTAPGEPRLTVTEPSS